MVAKKSKDLFFFIAKQIKTFLEAYHKNCLTVHDESDSREVFSLGFTFSFPAYQDRIDSGRLLRWTKGFDIPDAVGQDVCQLLQHEIDLLCLPVKITALVNDAAGTIMSRAYTLPVSQTRTSIGVILGTGTNCVYVEKLSKIIKPLDGQYDKTTGEMLISIEWGSFDNSLLVLPNSSYDAELNEMSVNIDNQMFEKRVSGMFLGELLRIAILAMSTDPEIKLFYDHDSGAATTIHENSPLHTRWSVDSSILSVAEADNSSDLALLRQKIEESLDIVSTSISVEDAQAVKVIAHAIGKRAARLAGMAIGAVVLQSQRLENSVGPIVTGEKCSHPIDKLNKAVSDTSISSDKIAESAHPVTAKSATDLYPLCNDPTSSAFEHGIVDIGVDGSVIECYPGFEVYMREALSVVEGIGVTGEKRIRIGIAKDGSSVGAAIIALLATRQT